MPAATVSPRHQCCNSVVLVRTRLHSRQGGRFLLARDEMPISYGPTTSVECPTQLDLGEPVCTSVKSKAYKVARLPAKRTSSSAECHIFLFSCCCSKATAANCLRREQRWWTRTVHPPAECERLAKRPLPSLSYFLSPPRMHFAGSPPITILALSGSCWALNASGLCPNCTPGQAPCSRQ